MKLGFLLKDRANFVYEFWPRLPFTTVTAAACSKPLLDLRFRDLGHRHVEA